MQKSPPIVLEKTADSGARMAFAVGDVHGCYSELIALEEKIVKHARKFGREPFLVYVGDLCDRGLQSREVIEHVRLGVEAGTHLCLLGNHEQFLLQVVAGARKEQLLAQGVAWPAWLPDLKEAFASSWMGQKGFVDHHAFETYFRIQWAANGGTTCMQSYGVDIMDPASVEAIPVEHLRFLLSCPLVFESTHGIVSHAFMDRQRLDMLRAYQDGEDIPLHTVRELAHHCMWERAAPKTPVGDSLQWHFSGHTPVRRVRRSARNRWMQIDTGCVYGERLTAVNIETRQILSVKTRKG